MHYEPVSVPIRRLWRARRRCRSGYGHSAFRSIVEPANCRRRIIGLRRLLKHTSGDATFTTWRPRTGNGCMAFDSHAFALCKLSLTNQPYLNAGDLGACGPGACPTKNLARFCSVSSIFFPFIRQYGEGRKASPSETSGGGSTNDTFAVNR